MTGEFPRGRIKADLIPSREAKKGERAMREAHRGTAAWQTLVSGVLADISTDLQEINMGQIYSSVSLISWNQKGKDKSFPNGLKTPPGLMSAVTSCEDFIPVFLIQAKHLLEAMVSGNDLQPPQWVCYKTSGVSAAGERSTGFATSM